MDSRHASSYFVLMGATSPPLLGHETIGDLAADEQARGLKIQCQGCPSMTCIPFRLLARDHQVWATATVAEVALRLRCRRCETRVTRLDAVTLWRPADDQPNLGRSPRFSPIRP